MRFITGLMWKRFCLLLLLGTANAAHAEFVPPVGYTYEITIPGDSKRTLFSTPQAAAEGYVAGGNSYYSGSAAKVRYTLLRVYPCTNGVTPTGASCWGINWFFDWHFSSTSSESDYIASRIYTNPICPSGYISGVAPDLCWRDTPPPPPLALTLTATAPVIPQASVVSAGKVLTRIDLLAAIQQQGTQVSGKTVTLGSNRGLSVDLFSPAAVLATDASGKVLAQVSTRLQPATSTLSGSLAGLATPTYTNVTWLPAKYEAKFLLTCYTIADEALAEKTSTAGVCGLPEKQSYRAGFLKDVKMQGSGVALDGKIIHYSGGGCFNIDTCARTSTGACATVGTTIAVDPNIIPKKSSVNVKAIGSRKAQDTGGRIRGNHIDEYLGPQPAMCKQLGRRTSEVTFESY